MKLLSRLTLCDPIDQAPPMGFSKQEYWSGLPFPSTEDLPNPAIEIRSPALEVGFFTTMVPGKPKLGTVEFTVPS